MNSFVITGKASKVFDMLKLKAQYAEECEQDYRRAAGNVYLTAKGREMTRCPFNPKAMCNKPADEPCEKYDCYQGVIRRS